jgi:hypothetical protein
VAIDPSDRILAVTCGRNFAFYNIAARKLIREVAANSSFRVGFSPDGQYVVLQDNVARVYRTKDLLNL